MILRVRCEDDHLFFARYFFKVRTSAKLIVNWHHKLLADVVQDVLEGRRKNVVITIAPGSSKTEFIVINFIAHGLAKNPHARFLHLSGSDSLATLNSDTAREIVRSAEFQELWPLLIAEDADSKKRWNVLVDGKKAGGVYATSLGGQVTGFRAGHMSDGFQGALVIDDPIKPEDAFSKTKLNNANRRLLTTVKSRLANPNTPIVLVMQRLSDHDPVAFIKSGNLGKDWDFITIPALLDESYVNALAPKYRDLMNEKDPISDGKRSYWQYKEPLDQLLNMARGEGSDEHGSLISRHVFSSQYQQDPVALGGNVIKSADFKRWKALPKLRYRKIYADTAQKTAEHNDYSVFACWGNGSDGKIYLLDILRGKWESPELKRRARAFWAKHKAADSDEMGILREMMVEDKSSGTDVIQTLRLGDEQNNAIPVKPIERTKDKYSRVQDVLPYIELGQALVPEDAPFTNDFLEEHEAFKADMSHAHDDQVDTTIDAVMDMLSNGNKMNTWRRLANDA